MRVKTILIITSLFISFCSFAFAGEKPAIDAAISDSSRPAEHIERDGGRQPAEVLKLAKIKPGQSVAEIASGGGYYTALLSRLLGVDGTVYAVDPQLIFEAFPNAREGFQKYIESDPRDNVIYSIQRLDEFKVPESLDHIFMVLYYHDTYWTGENREQMNQRFYDALKPGGYYFVLDHSAKTGSGQEVTQTLHRMDEALLAPEVLGAGFKLVGQFDLLRNSEDPLDVSVFDAVWRGKTDRFIYLFQKPEQ